MIENQNAAREEPHSRGVAPRLQLGMAAASLALATASWMLLYLRLWLPGLETGYKDARHYIASAVRLAAVGRLELLGLRLDPVRVVSDPLSSFPPLTSWALAAMITAGVTAERSPTLLALGAWPLLLGGIALLTYRLCRDAVLAVFAAGIAAVTWPYLNIYTQVSSEILFLPLIVVATAMFTGLPERDRRILLPLATGSALTALVLLTRYTGMFFYAALLAWWVWHRARQGRWQRLVPELAILAIPGLVFLLWLARNVALTGHLFGPVLMSETLDVGYRHVVGTFLTQGTWLVLPAVRPGPVWRAYGLLGAGLVLGLAGTGAYLLWRARGRARLHLPSSPLLPFLAVYVGFLAVAPTFMRMQGMTERYMAVVLALAQPYLVARLAGARRRWTLAFLAAFLVLQLGLALSLTGARRGLGFWIEQQPLHATDLGGRPDAQLDQLLAGAPAWWVHRPPRLHDVEHHLPELHGILDRIGPDVPIVSNAPALFSTRPLLPVGGAVETWMEHGGCRPPIPVAVVVVDWDRWARGGRTGGGGAPADRLRTLMSSECPEATRFETSRATVYLLSVAPRSGASGEPREGHS